MAGDHEGGLKYSEKNRFQTFVAIIHFIGKTLYTKL